jgi:hypothetical protein
LAREYLHRLASVLSRPDPQFSPVAHLILDFWAKTIPAHPRKTPSPAQFCLRHNPRPQPGLLSPSPSKSYPVLHTTGGERNCGEWSEAAARGESCVRGGGASIPNSLDPTPLEVDVAPSSLLDSLRPAAARNDALHAAARFWRPQMLLESLRPAAD